MNTLVSPSILSADFTNLQKDIEMINASNADWIHFDVMDGVFVPNISFGFPVMEAVEKIAKRPLDVHYMVINPEKFIQRTADLGAMMMTVHQEVCNNLADIINKIHAAGMKAGVAINPDTPIETITGIVDIADMILIMTVFPGFGGQKFMENCLDKVRDLRKIIKERGLNTHIQVDGGVQNETAPRLVEAGADVLVSGSYIFKSADPIATIDSLKALR